MKNLPLLLLIIISLFSCIPDRIENREIKVANNSNETIYCLKSTNDIIEYPYIEYDFGIITDVFKIKPNTIGFVKDKPTSWDLYINGCKNGKLRLFIITQNSLDKYGWKEILEKNIYDKVYFLDMDDLKKVHWRLSFDGLNK